MESWLNFDSRTRHAINVFFVEKGHVPDAATLASRLECSENEVAQSFLRLAENHGLLLHPGTVKIWAAHPFSAAPTPFCVTARGRTWWGNCAWCSLGIASMIPDDVRIISRLGAESEPVEVTIHNGQLDRTDLVVHLAVPAAQWWDNVLYTCGTILFFRSEAHVDRWCRDHGIARGEVLTLDWAWDLAQAWYGDCLNPNWRRRTRDEAQAVLRELGLSSPFWQLPDHWK